MNEREVAAISNERVEIHQDNFDISSLYNPNKMDSILKIVDASIKKMLIPGATVILEMLTSRRKKEKRLTNLIKISKYDNDNFKRVLHVKLKNALSNNFKKKDHGCKINVWYEQIILYPPLYRGTNPSI